MKTRQYRQLMTMDVDSRMAALSKGLDQIAAYVDGLAQELSACGENRLVRASVLLRNVVREEAGKFLILLDSCRLDRHDQKTIAKQLARAGDHLSKLVYAQIADYALGDQQELLRAVELHRRQYHLDGPNDVDFIMPNWLIAERESALYVDLVDYDGVLEWSGPYDRMTPEPVPKSVTLTIALHRIGATTPAGLHLMNQTWRDFDPTVPSHHMDWVARNDTFIEGLGLPLNDEIANAAQIVAWEWPMPMARIDVGLSKVDLEDLRAERDVLLQARLASADVDADWTPTP